MNQKVLAMLWVLVFLLGAVGIAGAQLPNPTGQTLLPGALIPQFIDPLPVGSGPDGTGITVLIPTAGVPYPIRMYEFQAQILPTTGVPLAVPPIPQNTGSWVWGYLTDADVASLPTVAPWRASYLGPVVVATRGVATEPVYSNELPYPSLVQLLLPIDKTLDWAAPDLANTCKDQAPPNGTCLQSYQGPQPAVPHLHGGEVLPLYDGGPDAWWLPVNTIYPAVKGAASIADTTTATATFQYPNAQQAGTIWFHDHALGITRLNVYAGMAGVHIITDSANEPPQATEGTLANPGTCVTTTAHGGCLPNGKYDIPLIIQDRSFDVSGQIYYNLASNPQPNPTVHPFWIPEFIGDTIVVNGKTWPYLNVEPRKYRFRLVNGSNARFYDLTLPGNTPFTVIATDDGYLNAPVVTKNVIIGPGERYEVIVDFAKFRIGTNLVMKNAARTPYPGGAAPVRGTTDTVMQFRVALGFNGAIPDATLPTNLRPNNTIVDITAKAVANRTVPAAGVCPAETLDNPIVRQLTLNEVLSPTGPLELVLNNTKFNGIITNFSRRESEVPAVGDTEIWEIINITADAHPIHTHLASFQLLNRQGIRATPWIAVYINALTTTYGANFDAKGPPLNYLTRNADCAIGGNPAIGAYLRGQVRLPSPYEMGWKDTVIAYPGEVTRFVIRWGETQVPVPATCVGNPPPGTSGCPEVNNYPFDPVDGVGYVWHCHIIDHEDNEMMRPYIVGATRQSILN